MELYNWTVFCECRRAYIRYQNATHDLDPFKKWKKTTKKPKKLIESNEDWIWVQPNETICGWNKRSCCKKLLIHSLNPLHCKLNPFCWVWIQCDLTNMLLHWYTLVWFFLEFVYLFRWCRKFLYHTKTIFEFMCTFQWKLNVFIGLNKQHHLSNSIAMDIFVVGYTECHSCCWSK